MSNAEPTAIRRWEGRDINQALHVERTPLQAEGCVYRQFTTAFLRHNSFATMGSLQNLPTYRNAVDHYHKWTGLSLSMCRCCFCSSAAFLQEIQLNVVWGTRARRSGRLQEYCNSRTKVGLWIIPETFWKLTTVLQNGELKHGLKIENEVYTVL